MRKVLSLQSSACQSPKFYLNFNEKDYNFLGQYHNNHAKKNAHANMTPNSLPSERRPKEIKSTYRQSPQEYTQRKSPNNMYTKAPIKGTQAKTHYSSKTIDLGTSVKNVQKQVIKEQPKVKSPNVFDAKVFQDYLEKNAKSKSLTKVKSYREIGNKSPHDIFGYDDRVNKVEIPLERKRSNLVLPASNSRSLISTALNTKTHSQLVSPKVIFLL